MRDCADCAGRRAVVQPDVARAKINRARSWLDEADGILGRPREENLADVRGRDLRPRNRGRYRRPEQRRALHAERSSDRKHSSSTQSPMDAGFEARNHRGRSGLVVAASIKHVAFSA
jgi:hypothetical protein